MKFSYFQLKKYSVGILILLLAGLLVACGDQTPAGNSSTPVANLPRLNLQNCAIQAAAAPPRASAAAAPTPEPGKERVPVPAGFRLFVSSLYPYALAYPDNWVSRENQAAGNLKSDLFVGERSDKGTAFAFVLSEKLDNPAIDTKVYLDSKIKEAKANTENLQFDQQADRVIAGQTANVVAFNYEKPYQVQQVQVIFVAEGRGWVITYSASPNLGQQFCGGFSQILDTFTLTGNQ